MHDIGCAIFNHTGVIFIIGGRQILRVRAAAKCNVRSVVGIPCEFDVQICHQIGSQDVSIFSARSSESNIKTYYCKVCCEAKKSLFLAMEISLEEYNKG